MNEDMDIPEKPGPLAEARKSYVQFHLLASLEDEQLLDLLVMTSAALILIMNASRNHVPPVIRGGLEKTIGATEGPSPVCVKPCGRARPLPGG